MSHPFLRIARLLLGEMITLAGQIRGNPIGENERADIFRDFEHVAEVLARILAAIPREHLLQLFPEHRRSQVLMLLAVVDTVCSCMDKLEWP